jgi:hypothetical protein
VIILKNQSKIPVLFVLLATAVFAQRPPTNFKDMDAVSRLYVAPIIGDDANIARFRAALKYELVKSGFVVLEKAEHADATLLMELTIEKTGNLFAVETHATLDAGADNRASWNNGTTKTGPDLDRLLADRARYIAQSLKSYKSEVSTKAQEKREKEAKH